MSDNNKGCLSFLFYFLIIVIAVCFIGYLIYMEVYRDSFIKDMQGAGLPDGFIVILIYAGFFIFAFIKDSIHK